MPKIAWVQGGDVIVGKSEVKYRLSPGSIGISFAVVAALPSMLMKTRSVFVFIDLMMTPTR